MFPHADSYRVLVLPYRGAPQSVAAIKDGALKAQGHPIVRLLAEEVCRYLPSKDCTSEAMAFYYLVLDRCRYMRDPRTVELVRAPWLVVRDLMAGRTPSLDCDDSSSLLAAFCLASGAETRVVTVAYVNAFYRGQRQYSHVFCQCREPRTNQWITIDPVAGDKTNEMMSRAVAAKFWPIA